MPIFAYFDPMYLLFALPGLILAGIATMKMKSTFAKYSRVTASSGLTGAQAARQMLDTNGLRNVQVEAVRGFLSDHYDPRHKVLRLSPPVYGSNSLSAIGVACHEAGHALQDAQSYAPLSLRSAMVPITTFGSKGAYLFLLLGFIMSMPGLVNLGLICFAAVVLFSLVTLPVEWDASARAKKIMVSSGIVTEAESADAGSVLNAAFLTYVASAVTALMQFLYLFLRSRR
jgi:Zn-dependent membrane protease YugP